MHSEKYSEIGHLECAMHWDDEGGNQYALGS